MKCFKFILVCLFLVFCVSCSSNQKTEPVATELGYVNSIDNQVAYEIENIKDIDSFDDETIKALSVVVRTNILNDNSSINKTEVKATNERIINLSNETSGEVLANEDNQILTNKINIETSENKTQWVKEIKKIDILKFLNRKKIKVSNLSKINQIKNSDGKTQLIDIGGKFISYKEIKNEFNLPSNEIISIKGNVSTITISGYGDDFDFNINNVKNLSLEEKSYKNILKYRYNDFKIITK